MDRPMQGLHSSVHGSENGSSYCCCLKWDKEGKEGNFIILHQSFYASGHGSRKGRRRSQMLDIRETSITG